MRVLHISSYYITSKLYKNLIENLEDKDIYNDVYIPVYSSDEIGKFEGRESEKSKYIYSKCFNYYDRIVFRLKNYKIYRDLKQKVDLESIDIVHAHSLFVNGYIAYKLKIENDIDYIVAVRSTDANVFFKRMIHLRRLGVDIMKNAKKVIFISPRYKENVLLEYVPKDLREQIEKKCEVIPNGIDDFWFENLDMKSKTIDKNNVRLICVGKLEKIKNMKTTMAVTKTLNELGYKATLDIVGRGPELDELNKLIQREYNGIVNMRGFMSREELIQLYRKNNIFILPSKFETFGLVYVEAISQGIPVIYTRDQGFDGYFKEGVVGYGVKHDDVGDITEKVIEIIDKVSWNLQSLEEELRKSFMWSNITNKYKKIYEDNIR